jgi:hypothetical protein
MPGAIFFPMGRPAPAEDKEDRDQHQLAGTWFGVIYANDLAKDAMRADPPIQFPRNSIIVRERLAAVEDATPQLLTVMIKRGRGFNPKANDWEFLSIDGATMKILERQKQGTCSSCHSKQANRDFVHSPPLD